MSKPWKVIAVTWSEEGNACLEIEGLTRVGIAEARKVEAVNDLLAALKEVVAISDRKHDAWDRAKAAIAKAEGVM